MAILDLAYIYEPYPAELAELKVALHELTGEEPQREIVQGYAGPNDLVQILIDHTNWQSALAAMAAFLGLTFGKAFVGEIGKQAAADIWKNKGAYIEALKQTDGCVPIKHMARALTALRQKGQTVSVGIRIPDTPRNATAPITSEDPAEIAWQMANVARCAAEIHDIILKAKADDQQHFSYEGNNPDLSIVIEVLENGDVRVLNQVISK